MCGAQKARQKEEAPTYPPHFLSCGWRWAGGRAQHFRVRHELSTSEFGMFRSYILRETAHVSPSVNFAQSIIYSSIVL